MTQEEKNLRDELSATRQGLRLLCRVLSENKIEVPNMTFHIQGRTWAYDDLFQSFACCALDNQEENNHGKEKDSMHGRDVR